MQFTQEGNIVDVIEGSIRPGRVHVQDGKIADVEWLDAALPNWIVPGFVDSHMHIESTKMSPHALGHMLVRQGVLGVIADPHEIANVCGVEGMHWMHQNARRSHVEVLLGVPPCVPAAGPAFETNGAYFDLGVVKTLLDSGKFSFLAEVMNHVGVRFDDPQLIGMIRHAQLRGMPIDGHAPGLIGEDLSLYASKGITSDHEAVTLEEARQRAQLGMYVAIREGSAAKNFEALIPLLAEYPDKVMFCTDDCEPHEIKDGQIDSIVRRALRMGLDPLDVFRAASLNPVKRYGMSLGLLQKGDSADFVVVSDLAEMEVRSVYRSGQKVHGEGAWLPAFESPATINNFHAQPIDAAALAVHASDGPHLVRVIKYNAGQLITDEVHRTLTASNGVLELPKGRDIAKLVVLNRYAPDARPQVAYVEGLGIEGGALASTVAHDSHNIIAVGIDDEQITEAINLLVQARGGQSLVTRSGARLVELPVGGLMSPDAPDQIAKDFGNLEAASKRATGSELHSVYMALSFLALGVIPSLKLTDKGLMDGNRFEMVPLFVR